MSSAADANAEHVRIYRLRGINQLLGEFEELSRQEIYFASPSQMNDPMEGLTDVRWHGDRILWRNLLKNYLLNVQMLLQDVMIFTEEMWTDLERPLWLRRTLPTDAQREFLAQAEASFFNRPAVAEVEDQLTRMDVPLTSGTVEWYLHLVHTHALDATAEALREGGIAEPLESFHPLQGRSRDEIPDSLLKLRPHLEAFDEAPANDLQLVSEVASSMIDEIELLAHLTHGPPPKRHWDLHRFPGSYLQLVVDSCVHPPWYAACFTRCCTNASMWGTYGEGHTGAALVFRAPVDEHGPYLRLNGVTGWTSTKSNPEGRPIRSWRPRHFHDVSYVTEPVRIDAFRDLGRLPHPVLHEEWHTGEGQYSARIRGAHEDLDAWRRAYHDAMRQSRTAKLVDWSHEEETRLLLHDQLDFHQRDRKFRYDFADLEGVVFGMRTTVEDKARIVSIIKDKCAADGRAQFAFWQASYSGASGRLVLNRIALPERYLANGGK